jgi:hypothetical protein
VKPSPEHDRRAVAVAVTFSLVVFAVLVLVHGRCAAWDVTAPPPPRCSP